MIDFTAWSWLTMIGDNNRRQLGRLVLKWIITAHQFNSVSYLSDIKTCRAICLYDRNAKKCFGYLKSMFRISRFGDIQNGFPICYDIRLKICDFQLKINSSFCTFEFRIKFTPNQSTQHILFHILSNLIYLFIYIFFCTQNLESNLDHVIYFSSWSPRIKTWMSGKAIHGCK